MDRRATPEYYIVSRYTALATSGSGSSGGFIRKYTGSLWLAAFLNYMQSWEREGEREGWREGGRKEGKAYMK